MDELFMRSAAPLGADIWKAIDETVENVARQQLVGRRLISLVGPVGIGALAVPAPKANGEAGLLTFTTLSQDFTIAYEDIIAAQHSGLPLEMGAVAQAVIALAKAEDELIFDSLRNAKGIQTAPIGEWDKVGGAFVAVAGALEKLMSAGVYGPYALVLSTNLYMQTQRVLAETGLLEIEQISGLINGDIYFAPTLQAKEGFLIANAPYNLDLVMAQDMITAYTANAGLDHTFRLMEKLAVRIKRPAAICALK